MSELRDAILARADKVTGWMPLPDLTFLHATAAALPENATWVELGAWQGRSTLAVGLSLPPSATLHVIDKWKDFNGHPAFQVPYEAYPREQFEIVRLQLADRLTVKIWEMSGNEAAQHIPDKSCDVVFIDADHEYESVLADCRTWEPKLKPGGLLCGHDYAADVFPGVVRAVNELYGGRFSVIPYSSIWRVTLPS
jgi:predicted O-methyltransferase YrrM